MAACGNKNPDCRRADVRFFDIRLLCERWNSPDPHRAAGRAAAVYKRLKSLARCSVRIEQRLHGKRRTVAG